jgi:uncharacterized protein (DUF849 family)
MFSTGMTFSFPPEPWAVEAYAKLLEKTAPGAPWMVAGLAVDVLPLIPTVVALGGGVRVGLEDAPYPNAALQRRAGRSRSQRDPEGRQRASHDRGGSR